MTSRQQQFDEKRAEAAAAKVAAKDLDEVNRSMEHDSSAANQKDQEKPGVIGSMLKAVQNTYENAKEVVVGKKDHPADSYANREEVVDVIGGVEEDVTGEVRDISATKSHPAYDSSATDRAGSKVGEYTDYAAQKTKETKDATQQKASEYAGYAGEKAKEAKDKTMEKAGEYKDYAAEKAKEGKDATMEKMGEYKDYTAEKAKEGKDSATDAAKRAIGYLGEKKDETKQKTAETAEAAKNKTAETAEAAKNKTAESAVAAKDSATDAAKRAMGYLGEKKEETKQRTAETAEAAKNKTAETTEAAKQKTSEAMNRTKENLSGADEEARRKIGDLKLQDKDYNNRNESGDRSGKVEIKVEETRPGKVAEALKAADQMTGQTFNDVGRMDDEGVVKKAGLLDRKY